MDSNFNDVGIKIDKIIAKIDLKFNIVIVLLIIRILVLSYFSLY